MANLEEFLQTPDGVDTLSLGGKQYHVEVLKQLSTMLLRGAHSITKIEVGHVDIETAKVIAEVLKGDNSIKRLSIRDEVKYENNAGYISVEHALERISESVNREAESVAATVESAEQDGETTRFPPPTPSLS